MLSLLCTVNYSGGLVMRKEGKEWYKILTWWWHIDSHGRSSCFCTYYLPERRCEEGSHTEPEMMKSFVKKQWAYNIYSTLYRLIIQAQNKETHNKMWWCSWITVKNNDMKTAWLETTKLLQCHILPLSKNKWNTPVSHTIELGTTLHFGDRGHRSLFIILFSPSHSILVPWMCSTWANVC